MTFRPSQHPWLLCAFGALFVGILAILPPLLAHQAIGDAYQGVPYAGLDNEDEYLTRMHEVVDGHWRMGSTFYFEYKSFASPLPPYAEYVYAIPAMLLRTPLTNIVAVTKFLFPALLFALIYALMWRIAATAQKKDRTLLAITTAAVVTLGYEWASIDTLRTFFTTGAAPVDASLWTRPTNPILGALLLFGFLHVLWSTIQKKGKVAPVVAGLLMGAMAFYVFTWTTALSVLLFIGAAYAATKQWTVVRRLSGVLLVGILALLPGLLPVLGALNGLDPSASERNGLFHTHVPLLNKTTLIAVVMFAVLSVIAAQKEKWRDILRRDWWLFGAGILAACLWVYAQQLLTGRTVWPYHFVQYTKPLIAVVLLLTTFFTIRPHWPRLWRTGLAALLALVLFNGTVTASSGRAHLDAFRDVQRYGPAFDWLNAHAQKDCVVLVPDNNDVLVGWVTALTHCNVYLSAWIFSGVPHDRIVHDFYIRLRLANVGAGEAQSYLEAHPNLIRAAFYETWPQLLTTQGRDAWVDQKIAEVAPGYAAYADANPEELLKRYRVDYLLTEWNRPLADWQPWGVTEEMQSFDGLTLYAF